MSDLHPPFARRLLDWQRVHGRRGLPWQDERDPYRVWLSEIMLQQTQVAAVLPYYARFLEAFPDVAALAAAPADEVMRLWSGLGYYSRARNLHAAAKQVMAAHGGRFPGTAALLEALPGVGRSTAAAVAAFTADERVPILDGNVKRVLCRVFGIEGDPATRAVEQRLWALAGGLLPPDAADMPAYTQGLMDLGATVCTRARPRCTACPMEDGCVARREDRTAQLPTPRARRVVPRRTAAMLVLRRPDGAVWVERRPDRGIWGGLWSLPQAEDDEAAIEAAAARLGAGGLARQPLARFEHTFTHFILDVRPLVIETDTTVPPAAGRWLAAHEVTAAGLPQPVKRLLGALATPDLLSP